LPASFRRLTVATVVSSLVLVGIGGLVRATDAGLACPTWPGCFSSGDFVPPADLAVWTEHTHRLVAGIVALMIAWQLVWALLRFRDRPALLWAAGIAALLVIAQALLGAVVVLLKLRAELVTAHLGLAMALVGVLLYLAVATTGTLGRRSGLARMAASVAGVTYLQILVGGHTSGIGSGLAYVDQPLLGVFAVGPIGTEEAAFNVLHRALAVVVLAGVMVLAAQARRSGESGWLARLPRIAAWLVTLQIALGVANLATSLSFVTVVPHLVVASWLWAVLVLEALLASRAPVRVTAPTERSAVGVTS